MKIKVRISHFTTKNIEANEIPKPSAVSLSKFIPSKDPVHQIKKERTRALKNKKPPTGIKLERIVLKKEANYANTPKYQESEIINCIIKKEVTVFRNIK